jgi:N6-adenosine-specific RNA methylase IME4
MMTGELVHYDAMCRAIDTSYRIDEVKGIRDAATALEHAARIAKNKEAVRRCGAVRLRAERKAGTLLEQRTKATGALKRGAKLPRSNGATTETLTDLGITKTQSSQWQQLAKIPEETFSAALAKAVIPTTNGLLKKPRRDQRERDLGDAIRSASAKLGTKLYGVIYADPPWDLAPYSRETGMDRAAANHYPTMTLDAIKAIKVPAARDAVLFLWATAPMLPQALDVMAAWGFTYKSHCVWLKDRIGLGYWFRSKHELLLVGTRGNIPAPAPGEQMDSVIACAARRHSEKPAAFAELIDGYFPTLEGLEMFARGPRLGWAVWGAEVE